MPKTISAYCDHCGFPIYRPEDGLKILVNGDRIHKDCWEEYAEEHMNEFTAPLDGAEPEDEA